MIPANGKCVLQRCNVGLARTHTIVAGQHSNERLLSQRFKRAQQFAGSELWSAFATQRARLIGRVFKE
eukprot:686688-Alexandrium_andersonii.AAC.1